jgi:hypothetical protein
MTKLHVYVLGPIDFWEGWIAPETLGASGNFEVSAWHPDDVLARLDEAKKAASAAGWEGDGDFHLSMLPMRDSHQCEALVAIKQGNNGTTFIITPFEMPWLGEPHATTQPKSRW